MDSVAVLLVSVVQQACIVAQDAKGASVGAISCNLGLTTQSICRYRFLIPQPWTCWLNFLKCDYMFTIPVNKLA